MGVGEAFRGQQPRDGCADLEEGGGGVRGGGGSRRQCAPAGAGSEASEAR